MFDSNGGRHDNQLNLQQYRQSGVWKLTALLNYFQFTCMIILYILKWSSLIFKGDSIKRKTVGKVVIEEYDSQFDFQSGEDEYTLWEGKVLISEQYYSLYLLL